MSKKQIFTEPFGAILTAPAQPATIVVIQSPDIHKHIRNAVFWTQGLTISGFRETEVTMYIDQKNYGKVYSQRHKRLRTGVQS